MKRHARLQSARSWLKTYSGKNIVAGYRKHFRVDWGCAFKELEMLGVKIDVEYKNELLKTLAGGIEARRLRRLRREEALSEFSDGDETFARIVDHTEAGFADGITRDEWDPLDIFPAIDDDRDIPF